MASSSTDINKCTHDVFLSFRGADTRYTFTGHLHQALLDKGIYVFIDNELQRGGEITPQLLGVIKESRVTIVVLSERYASSSFCLDELVKILECRESKRQVVIPVFYHVDPTDVEEQRGAFGQEFAKLEAELDKPDIHEDFYYWKFIPAKAISFFRYAPVIGRLVEKQNERATTHIERVQNWKLALTKVATLSGYHLKEGDHEASTIQNIVKEVSKLLHHVTTLHVGQNLVGLDSRVEYIHQMLKIESDEMCMLGLHGMGGVGKTTLAKALFNKWAMQFMFDGCCFLENVRETSKNNGLTTLQEKLLCEILRDQNLQLGNSDKGIEVIKHRLGCKKVLILIDDVDNIEQLQKLAGKLEWFGAGSRIIITTRNSRLLEQHDVKMMYEVRKLKDDLAIKLFSWHAFKEPQPREAYVELTHRALRYAKGLPLALKVLGSSLYKESVQYWDEILEKLGQCRDDEINMEIFNVLKVSYDSLDREEKIIFLDVAFFFKGRTKDTVVKFLNACGFSGFTGVEKLIKKSLLDGSRREVWMHDLLQEMGTRIAFENSSRLCIRKVDDIPGLSDKRTYVEILLLDLRGEEEVPLNWLENLTNLRVLVIRNGRFIKMPKKLPNSIRWLEWRNGCLKSISSRFFPPNLFVLEMHCGNSKKFVMDMPEAQKFMNLTYLNLSNSEHLREIVIDFSSIPNIEMLELRWCRKLKKIHKSVGSLKDLEELDLRGCANLTSLPNLVNNECLKYINIEFCSKLENLSNLPTTITSLELKSSGIKEIPLFIGNLINFQHVIVSFYENLMCASNGMYELWPETFIQLRFCPKPLQCSEIYIEMVSSNPTLALKGVLDLTRNTSVSVPKNTFEFIHTPIPYLSDCQRLVEILELPAKCPYNLVRDSRFQIPFTVGENEKKSWKEMVEKERSIKRKERMRFMLIDIRRFMRKYSIIFPIHEMDQWLGYEFNFDASYHCIQLPSSLFNLNLIAIAFSAIFQPPTYDAHSNIRFSVNEFEMCCADGYHKLESDHMWLGLKYIDFELPKLLEAEEIWCKFYCDKERAELKRVGVHLIYKNEDDEHMTIAPHYFEATSELVEEDNIEIEEDDLVFGAIDAFEAHTMEAIEDEHALERES